MTTKSLNNEIATHLPISVAYCCGTSQDSRPNRPDPWPWAPCIASRGLVTDCVCSLLRGSPRHISHGGNRLQNDRLIIFIASFFHFARGYDFCVRWTLTDLSD